ncbi:MAG: hypothetical protein WCR55_00005 [Lentisphaerota bacterium]
MNNLIRLKTVKLLARFIKPLTEEGLITVPEQNEILAQLKYLAEKGTQMPAITPKLIDQAEASEMLGIGISNFKKLEKEGAFPFNRKMVGSAVRYRNTDIIDFLICNSL